MSQNETSNDLGAMISQLLSDPQKVQQIQQMASSLGLGSVQSTAQPSDAACSSQSPHPPQNGTTSPSGAPDLSSLISALGLGQPASPQSPALDPSILIGLQGIMQRFSQSSPGVDLLRALRPLLSERRAKKVDDAVRMMQLIQALPALKEIGLFRMGGGL